MISSVVLAAVLALTQPAPAVSPEAQRDLDCLVVTTYALGMVDEGDANAVSGLTGGVAYYLGRLQGRDPGVDWLRHLESDPAIWEQSIDPANAQRCSAEMMELGQDMMAFGDRLSRLAQ